ncbi:MAG: NAD-dependent epimerase/dehydratase family protein [Oscillospiraceae bacterium]|jgi:nucleoside-diphosphate-sugar epimerase|nr:NAD-dependent epimerase/dehydratase family protein [Oscillospiraceae bacterium]
MKKNVLIVGGNAFVGRIFAIQASKTDEYRLHVVNRGNFPLNIDNGNVTEYKCDRHSPKALARLLPPDAKFDALIDFCAYNAGDIHPLLSALSGKIKHYIYFSTASVYAPEENADGKYCGEGGRVLSPSELEGDVGAYVRGKIVLEKELTEACQKENIPYTILRPTFIYGPFNYAPRESYFIELIARHHVVPVPTDSDARFNFVYALDVSQGLMKCVGNEKTHNQIFNLASPEPITYTRLISDFERFNGGPFETREVTVAEADAERLPLPFPLTGDLLYSGEKFEKTLDFQYTPFSEGMERTFKIFYSLFTT